jgi:hypothetical protein
VPLAVVNVTVSLVLGTLTVVVNVVVLLVLNALAVDEVLPRTLVVMLCVVPVEVKLVMLVVVAVILPV